MNKTLTLVAISLAVVAYPFVIYQSMGQWGPSLLALGLFGILFIRFIVTQGYKQLGSRWVFMVACFFFSLVIFLDSSELLLYYPVLMNASIACLFLASLKNEQSLIEHFAAYGGKRYPEEAKIYMRKLSLIWGVILLANSCFAAYTACCSSLSFWSLYNGFLSYLLIGLVMLIELIFRHFYKKSSHKQNHL